MEPSDQRPADDCTPAPVTPAQAPDEHRVQSGEQPREPRREPRREKVKIMDLARYKVGQRAYWVVFRAERYPEFDLAEPWMKKEHPFVLWRHKIVPWDIPMKPPRAHPGDTMAIMMLCGQTPRIEPFRITEVERSANSGTFLYTGPKGMVMPEGLLFPNKAAARREIARIAKMFAAWTATWAEGSETPPKKE